jgi:type I restriction enzyme S subunit
MIEGLKPYAEYKESGLPWLGRYPKNWNVRRAKILFHERVQKGFPNEPLLAATQTKGVVKKADYETRTVTAQKDLHLLKLVEVGDYVISLRSFQGGIEIAHCRGIISPAYTVLKPQGSAMSGYYSHFFKAKPFIDSLSLFVTGIREGQNIDYERLSRAELPMPPSDEQAAIVRFLDNANRKIDGFIRAKRKLIGLLNEQKQVIIHRAVTRGLNPDVPLKPSGIPWLGDIPGHWEVRRAKYVFREIEERSKDGREEQLSVSHITGVTPRSQKNITMFKAESCVGHKLCRPGDLAVNTMWAWMAALGVSKYEGIISPAYAVYRQRKPECLLSDYADHLLRIAPYKLNYLLRSTGLRASRLRLYPDEFFKIPIMLPPKNEQQQIIDLIYAETSALTTAIARAEREIALMQEYRTRLAADIVTGKLDVREAAAKLPEVPADPGADPVADASQEEIESEEIEE